MDAMDAMDALRGWVHHNTAGPLLLVNSTLLVNGSFQRGRMAFPTIESCVLHLLDDFYLYLDL